MCRPSRRGGRSGLGSCWMGSHPSHAVVGMWSEYGAAVITSIITATQQRVTVMKELRIEGNQMSAAPPTCACWHAEKGQKSHQPNPRCRLPSRLVSALLAFFFFYSSTFPDTEACEKRASIKNKIKKHENKSPSLLFVRLYAV